MLDDTIVPRCRIIALHPTTSVVYSTGAVWGGVDWAALDRKHAEAHMDDAHQTSKRQQTGSEDLVLKDAVLSLNIQHQKVDVLILEAAQRVKKQKDRYDVNNTVVGLYLALQAEAKESNRSLSTLASSVFCKQIALMLRDKPDNTLVFSEDERALVKVLISLVKKVQLGPGFNRTHLIKAINKDTLLPIELVWQLHQDGLMTYSAYITCNLNRPNVIGSFAQSITQLCFCDPTCQKLEMRKAIIQDVMTFLVGQGYMDQPVEGGTSKGMRKVSTALLDSITKKLLSDDCSSPAICLYEPLMTAESPLDLAILQRYANRQITIILSHNPHLKVSDALQQQKGWTFGKTPRSLTDTYKHLLLVFSAEEVMNLVALILEQQEVNWRAVLTFTSTLLVILSASPALLQGLVTSLLRKAFEHCEKDNLILGFLLARQGALEGPHVFPSYADWFQKTFTEPHSLASNKKSFAFLLKFLTDLVPYEDPVALRAHVLHPPSIPSKCRHLLADYVILAKTRLQDLKVPIEEMSIYDEGQTAADKEKVMQQAEMDVERALAGFEKTGKVPASVMETSIFRKPYFIGRFLLALLKPRPLPDTPDLKMKFIEVLYRNDKIPVSMYNTYEKTCLKESAHLLDGILSDEDDPMEAMLLAPGEQFTNSLSHLEEAIIRLHAGAPGKTGLASQISVLSEKIAVVMGVEPATTPLNKVTILNITTPTVTKEAMQLACPLVQAICRVTCGISEVKAHHGDWFRQVLAMMSRHGAVWIALLYRVWRLLTIQGFSLEPYHTQGLAAIILHMASDSTLSGHVTVRTPNKEGAYLDLLLQAIPCTTHAWMAFSLRFCTCYVEQAFRTFPQFSLSDDSRPHTAISSHIVKRFQYLAERLVPECRVVDTREAGDHPSDPAIPADTRLCIALYQSEQLHTLLDNISMSFSEWVSLEIDNHSHDDFLSCWQRWDYSQWFVARHVGAQYEASPQLCQTLAHAILQNDIRHAQPAVRHPACACPDAPPRGDSRDHMLLLLHTLIPLLPPGETLSEQHGADEEDVTDAVPWLRDVWRSRDEKLSRDVHSMSRHVEKMAFLRLARVLYPTFGHDR